MLIVAISVCSGAAVSYLSLPITAWQQCPCGAARGGLGAAGVCAVFAGFIRSNDVGTGIGADGVI